MFGKIRVIDDDKVIIIPTAALVKNSTGSKIGFIFFAG